ncbi:MAG: hypothetical protein Unbinned8622contig1005_28 [Prokaryotic dsDNA virus sp.]|nr:MAG: hypothetical protein Unbinned8622contig1005_28 [Prokaryotic dsDNA virus sp.]|tara:strand:+ start:17203 stop:18108 length:906 start_codon:yes stop_codon:yes gene_type:complete
MFRAMVKAKGMSAYGEEVFRTIGTHTFTVPDNVEYIACVCIGSGGGGASNYAPNAGQGGGLAYGTIKVTAGETLTVVVGDRGSAGPYNPGGSNAGGNGGPSYISRSGTKLIQAHGGKGGGNTQDAGNVNILAAEVSRKGSNTGGAGATSGDRFDGRGPGGGGAAGYSGNGGAGSQSDGAAGTGGAGGGGGGGKWLSSNFSPYRRQGGFGGGVSLYGEGTSGAGGIYDSQAPNYDDNMGGPGSHNKGTDQYQDDQEYGGGAPSPGGANAINGGLSGYSGKQGAVRIVWPGRARRYPSQNVAQ